jgi:hypothetical protein
MQSAHDLPLAQLLHAARALETRWRCSIEQECAHRTGPPNSMPCMALAKLTVRPAPRRTKSKVETFLISSGENHRLIAATHVEIRAVAVAVLAPACCHAAPWPSATRQRLHGYVCWSPQKKCSSPRNAHQSGSTARRPHTTFWWAWNPGCNFLPQEGAACPRRTRGPNTGSHQPCKPQPMYLTQAPCTSPTSRPVEGALAQLRTPSHTLRLARRRGGCSACEWWCSC